MADHASSSPLIAPSPIRDVDEIDLEAGPSEQIQCRICLETDGRDFIAPCKCKGTSKYVHRECLDHWRAVKGKYVGSSLSIQLFDFRTKRDYVVYGTKLNTYKTETNTTNYVEFRWPYKTASLIQVIKSLFHG